MWTLEPTHGLPRAAAGAAHLAAMALLLWFQELGQRLRREEHRAWWAGTGRDLLNAAGFCAIGGALRVAGYPGPAALLVAGTETLLLFGAYTFATRRTGVAHPRVWAIGVGLLVCFPAIAFPAAMVRSIGAAAASLFPVVR